MGHDMALADCSTKSAVFGYKMRWLLDIPYPITPESIRATALRHGGPWPTSEFVASWASRPGRGEITAHHEPIFHGDSWPWEGSERGQWTVVDMCNDDETQRLMAKWSPALPPAEGE